MRYKGSASVAKVPMLWLSPPSNDISLKNMYVLKCVMNIHTLYVHVSIVHISWQNVAKWLLKSKREIIWKCESVIP